MANEGFNFYVKKNDVAASGGTGAGVDLSAYAKKIDVQNDLDRKADRSYVDQQLTKKAGVAEVAAKADTVYVDAELAKKANTSDVAAKADKTYVDTQLTKKVDKTTKFVTNVTLSGKVITVTYSDNTTATLTLA